MSVVHGLTHGLRTPNERRNQRNLKFWADVADKICFGRTYKFGIGIWFPRRASVVRGLTVDLALLSKRKIDASILSLFCSGDRILYFFFFDFLDHYRQFQCILAPIFSLPRPESDLPTYLVICLWDPLQWPNLHKKLFLTGFKILIKKYCK